MSNVVYVVEDEQQVANSLLLLLSLESYDPRHFLSADDFLEQLPRLRAGIVIMNVRLRGTDGIEAAARMRRAGVTWPVIIVSGSPRESFAAAAADAEIDAYLEKPCDAEALFEALEAARNSRG